MRRNEQEPDYTDDLDRADQERLDDDTFLAQREEDRYERWLKSSW